MNNSSSGKTNGLRRYPASVSERRPGSLPTVSWKCRGQTPCNFPTDWPNEQLSIWKIEINPNNFSFDLRLFRKPFTFPPKSFVFIAETFQKRIHPIRRNADKERLPALSSKTVAINGDRGCDLLLSNHLCYTWVISAKFCDLVDTS